MTRRLCTSPAILLLVVLLLGGGLQQQQQQPLVVHAQRFLRSTSQMENDFRGEMKLDDNEAMAGMTREMFLMQDIDWELEPPVIDPDADVDGKLRQHINKYLHAPIEFKLAKKKGKYGMRAVGIMDNGKKLRGFWRQGAGGQTQLKSSDFLEASYDDAVRSRLFMVEFEVQLPPISKSDKRLPSVVYQVAVEPGGMNPKSMIPRGSGKIKIYPARGGGGRGGDVDDSPPCLDAGTCNVGLSMRSGLVDPTWSRGHKPFFPKGRSPGFI